MKDLHIHSETFFYISKRCLDRNKATTKGNKGQKDQIKSEQTYRRQCVSSKFPTSINEQKHEAVTFKDTLHLKPIHRPVALAVEFKPYIKELFPLHIYLPNKLGMKNLMAEFRKFNKLAHLNQPYCFLIGQGDIAGSEINTKAHVPLLRLMNR